jgi:amino acid transporter
MNTNNGIVRIIFAMSREGMLPARLATVHPVHRTPTTAIWVQGLFAVVLTFGVGLVAGPFNTYVYLGSILTLAIIPVYMLTNVACMRYFSNVGRAERSVLRHLVLPVAGILLLLVPVYGQVYPAPAAPLRYFPYVVLLYIAAAAVWATMLGRSRPEVLLRAGAVLATGDVSSAEPQEAR